MNITPREWVTSNKDKYPTDAQREKAIKDCVKKCKVTEKRVKAVFLDAWPTDKQLSRRNIFEIKSSPSKRIIKKKIKVEKSNPDDYGVSGFRDKFSKTQVRKRKLESMHDKIDNAIHYMLKDRVWITDLEFRENLGISMGEWSLLRKEYEHLIISDVVDENKIKQKIWGHPDHIDELRSIVEE